MQLQIEDLTRKLRTGDLGIPPNPEDRLGNSFNQLTVTLLPFSQYVFTGGNILCQFNKIIVKTTGILTRVYLECVFSQQLEKLEWNLMGE